MHHNGILVALQH